MKLSPTEFVTIERDAARDSKTIVKARESAPIERVRFSPAERPRVETRAVLQAELDAASVQPR